MILYYACLFLLIVNYSLSSILWNWYIVHLYPAADYYGLLCSTVWIITEHIIYQRAKMLCPGLSGEKVYILISRAVTGTALNCPWDSPFWIWLPGTSHDWYYNCLLWWGNILNPGIIHRTRFLNIHIAAGQVNGTRPINFPAQNMSFISNPDPYCRKNQYSQRRPSGKWIRVNVALPLFFSFRSKPRFCHSLPPKS